MEKEIQKSTELSFASDVHVTIGVTNIPKQYGDRMVDLNKRLLKYVLQQGVEVDKKLTHSIDVEVKKIRKTSSELEVFYKDKIKKAEEQQVEIENLRKKDTRLTKRVEELEIENEHLMGKNREQEGTIKDLTSKLAKMDSIRLENSDLKRKNDDKEEEICKLKVKKENYEEELMIFKRGSKYTMTAEKSMEVSLRNVNTIFFQMKSTFWSYVIKYFEGLKAEFETKMEKFQIAQINEYKELMKTLRDEHDELVSVIFKEKTELELEKRKLDFQVTQLTQRVKGYESVMHVSSKKATIKVGLDMRIDGDDARMKQQIDFYEALTNTTDAREGECSETKMTLDDVKCFFTEEAPDSIEQHFEDIKELFEDKHSLTIKSETEMFMELEHEFQQSKKTIENMKTMEGQESDEDEAD